MAFVPYLATGIAAGISGLVALPLWYKERFFFHPTSDTARLPGVPYQVVKIPYTPVQQHRSSRKQDTEGYLAGWLLRPEAQNGVILMCNGNGGNKSYHLSFAETLSEVYPGFSILMFDYEGYGDSYSLNGPSFEGLHKSTRTALLFLLEWQMHKQRNDAQVVVFGNSIGCGAVTSVLPYLSGRDTVILQNGFPSLRRIVEHYIPFPLSSLYGSALGSIFDNVQNIQRHQKKRGEHDTPYFCAVHSLRDEIIPFSLGKELGDACDLFIPAQGTHNEVCYTLEMKSHLRDIVDHQSRKRKVTFA